MTQEIFPEIQVATEALKTRIALTEAEVAQMKEDIKAKRAHVKSWRRALASVNPQLATKKKKRATAT
jgi:DNA/RNA-binding domain of Phe-tRNA-synthetase-like protein